MLGSHYSQSSLNPGVQHQGPATAGAPSSNKASLRLSNRAASHVFPLPPQTDKMKGLAQIYQPGARSKDLRGRNNASNFSLKSQSKSGSSQPRLGNRGGQGTVKGSLDYSENNQPDYDRQMRFANTSERYMSNQAQFAADAEGSSHDRLKQQAMIQTGKSAARRDLSSQHQASASPAGDQDIQGLFKSNSSMADKEALLQRQDDTIEDGEVDEDERARLEGTHTNLLR